MGQNINAVQKLSQNPMVISMVKQFMANPQVMGMVGSLVKNPQIVQNILVDPQVTNLLQQLGDNPALMEVYLQPALQAQQHMIQSAKAQDGTANLSPEAAASATQTQPPPTGAGQPHLTF